MSNDRDPIHGIDDAYVAWVRKVPDITRAEIVALLPILAQSLRPLARAVAAYRAGRLDATAEIVCGACGSTTRAPMADGEVR